MNKNFIVLLFEALAAFCIYESNAGVYQHPKNILFVFLSVLIYFIPTFIALYKKHKYSLQIAILNFFLGFTLVGWIGSLIWATLKTDKDESSNNLFILISIDIFMLLALIGYCIADYSMFNTEKIKQEQEQEYQQTIEAIRTLKEYYRD